MTSIKKDLLIAFTMLESTSRDENPAHLILVTSAGVISGLPVTEHEEKGTITSNLLDFIGTVIKEHKESNNIEDYKLAEGLDGFFSLKDVTIRSGNSTYTLPFLTVFYDQIVGVSVGNLS